MALLPCVVVNNHVWVGFLDLLAALSHVEFVFTAATTIATVAAWATSAEATSALVEVTALSGTTTK